MCGIADTNDNLSDKSSADEYTLNIIDNIRNIIHHSPNNKNKDINFQTDDLILYSYFFQTNKNNYERH